MKNLQRGSKIYRQKIIAVFITNQQRKIPPRLLQDCQPTRVFDREINGLDIQFIQIFQSGFV